MNHKIIPAIVVVAYNREKSLRRLLHSISKAIYPDEKITLIISIDYWKDDNPCYLAADQFQWKQGEKIVLKRDSNLGLRRHMLECGDLSALYEAVILLEDDVTVSSQFYHYAVEACNYYSEKEEVVGIGLYTHHFNGYAQYPFYPLKNGYDSYYEKWVISWGECFCKKQWQEFRVWYEEHNGELEYRDDVPRQITEWSASSWTKYLVYYMADCDKFFVSPYEAYSTNFSETGDHVKRKNVIWQSSMQWGYREFRFADCQNSIKYDLFFENMDLEAFKKKLGICEKLLIDLYGEHKHFNSYDYVLSTQKLPYKVVKSFGLEVKPIELNIMEGIEGEGIFLYDLRGKKEIKKTEVWKQNNRIYTFFYPLLNRRKTALYLFMALMDKIRK